MHIFFCHECMLVLDEEVWRGSVDFFVVLKIVNSMIRSKVYLFESFVESLGGGNFYQIANGKTKKYFSWELTKYIGSINSTGVLEC